MHTPSPHTSKSVFTLLLVAALVVAGSLAWALQNSGEPVALFPKDPTRKGVAVRLVPGDRLVLDLLQRFADYTGRPVYADGDISPTAAIALQKRVKKLDPRTTKTLLREHGYELTETDFRGRRVYWVQKLLNPSRRRGKLTQAGSAGKSPEPLVERTDSSPRSRATPTATGEPGGDHSLGLYRREDGRGARYVVLFETSSKAEAEEALSLLRAHRDR